MKKERKEERKSTIGGSLLMFAIIILFIGVGVIALKLDAYVPIAMASLALIGYGTLYLHIPWVDLRDSIQKSVGESIECVLIILFIGCTVGTWISSGTVPYIITIGLKLFSPSFFLPCIFLICAVMSMVTGSSYTTAGTIGVAFMGVSLGLGINPAITAGVIVSGAYFGDKQSPMSDTTNFAAAISKTTLYRHVHAMWYTTGPAALVCCVIFFFLGRSTNTGADLSTVNEIVNGLNGAFNFNPLLLLPLVMMIVLIAIKFPAIPCLLLCSVVGIIFSIIFQGYSLAEAGTFWYSGFVGNTGIDAIDSLLTRGGITSMWYTCCLMIVSLMMAGLITRCGVISDIMVYINKVVKSARSLVVVQLICNYILTGIASDPYLAMTLSAEAFGEKYDEYGLERNCCSRTLEDAITLGVAEYPWSSNAVYMSTTLGVATMAYFPYHMLAFITPIFSIICAFTGIGMFKAQKQEKANA